MQEDLNRVLKQLKKRNPQYTYLIFFFAAFSVFTMFIIRPSLVTAFSLMQKEKSLVETNNQYERVISNILATQSEVEIVRSKLHLTNTAVPTSPNVNGVLDDIKDAAETSGATIQRMNINKTALVYTNTQNQVQSIRVDVYMDVEFEKYLAFQEALYAQRRIKNIVSTEFLKDGGGQNSISSASSTLKIQMEIVAYYL
jgi:Tfp pilus assembly protein PilO